MTCRRPFISAVAASLLTGPPALRAQAWGASIGSASGHVDRIFEGVKAGDMPIEQPSKVELVINRKTAKALGLTLSSSLQLRAEVIE